MKISKYFLKKRGTTLEKEHLSVYYSRSHSVFSTFFVLSTVSSMKNTPHSVKSILFRIHICPSGIFVSILISSFISILLFSSSFFALEASAETETPSETAPPPASVPEWIPELIPASGSDSDSNSVPDSVPNSVPAPSAASEDPRLSAFPRSGESVLARLYKKNAPSVVYITGVNVQPDQKSPDEFFRPTSDSQEERTVGTGFIVHPDGYILTNAHAVSRCVSPEVELYSGHRVGAEIVSIFPNDDLALLKIDPIEKLTSVSFETQPELSIGDTVVTISCPHALKYTLTYGIISGMDRMSQVTDIPGLTLHNLLQTDASINPGSSGGPWFNLAGNVIGITVSKRSDSDNIAFGISLETLYFVFPQMCHRAALKKWELPFTIVGNREQVPHRARFMDLDPSFSQKSHIQDGETLLSLNGTEIHNASEFYLQLLSCSTGNVLSMEIERSSGEKYSASLTLAPHKPLDAQKIIHDRLRIRVRALTTQECRELNLRLPSGVLIESVDSGAYSGKNNPKPGDVFARLNYERPVSPEHLAEILENTPVDVPVNMVLLRQEKKGKETISMRIDIMNWRPPHANR